MRFSSKHFRCASALFVFTCLTITGNAFVPAIAVAARAESTVLWTHTPAADIKWYSLTDAGTVLVGTETSLYCLNPENGQISWQRDDLKGINEYETHEITGTPLLLVGDNSGAVMKKTKLFALNLLTGRCNGKRAS